MSNEKTASSEPKKKFRRPGQAMLHRYAGTRSYNQLAGRNGIAVPNQHRWNNRSRRRLFLWLSLLFWSIGLIALFW